MRVAAGAGLLRPNRPERLVMGSILYMSRVAGAGLRTGIMTVSVVRNEKSSIVLPSLEESKHYEGTFSTRKYQ